VLDGKVVEVGRDLGLAQFHEVPLGVKQDVLPCPVEVGLRGAHAAVLAVYVVPHFAQQLGSANNLVRVRGDVGIAAGRSNRLHALCPSLDILCDFRMLACCACVDNSRIYGSAMSGNRRLTPACPVPFAQRPGARRGVCSGADGWSLACPDWRERVALYAKLVRLDRPIGVFRVRWPAL